MPGKPKAGAQSPPNKKRLAEADLSEDERELLTNALAALGFDAKAVAQAEKDLEEFEEALDDLEGQTEKWNKELKRKFKERSRGKTGGKKREPWFEIRHDAITAARHIAWELRKPDDDLPPERRNQDLPPERREQFEALAARCPYWLARAAILEIVAEARRRQDESKRSPRPKEVRMRLDAMILTAEALLEALPGSSEDLEPDDDEAEPVDEEMLRALDYSFLQQDGGPGFSDTIEKFRRGVAAFVHECEARLSVLRSILEFDEAGEWVWVFENPALSPRGGSMTTADLERLPARHYLVLGCLYLAEWRPPKRARGREHPPLQDLVATVWELAFADGCDNVGEWIKNVRRGWRGKRLDSRYLSALVELRGLIPSHPAFAPVKKAR